ncbi:hypothetical protein C0Q70_09291 [Pomacea canaliculata]|uniref:Uncharacterized protein n=1 Tax=Pomacea canaliculata TaxID=400727 RepID=A0A2T7P9E2_POMCA|nr:hypothetical protein C0Q70_09291 [Pomacea canaliculata]
MDTSHEICLSNAVHQLQHYIESLQRCGVEIITLPANEEAPDSVFIEDTALVIGQRACLTRPALTSRRGEVPPVRDVLEKFGIETTELDDPSALLDGGDIIYTGQEILVGSSSRTNRAGIESLQRTFPEIPVTSIPIHGTLHLKSVATLAEADLLVIGGSSAAQSILQALKSRAQGQYRFLQLNGDVASNVINVNKNVLLKPAEEIGASDFKKLTEALSVPWIEVPFSEFYKADGCLSCCSLLIQAGN